MAARPILGLVSLVILAAGVLFQFFVILSGATYGTPEQKIYFLRADTSNIPGAFQESAWTFFALCAFRNNRLYSCRSPTAALPFKPSQNFGTTRGVPSDLNSNHYYYLSRTMFAFYLIALFFSVISLFLGLLALCTRLGAYFSGFMVFLACFFQALTNSLMTAWVVQGRNVFHNAGQQATIGSYAMGFSWGAFAAFFINTILFCAAGAAGKNKEPTYRSEKKSSSRRGLFGRKKDTSSGGVKDEYS